MESPVIQEETSGYKSLAASILYEAIASWDNQNGVVSNEISQGLGFPDTRSELLEFFASEWCLNLLLVLEIEPMDFFKRLGLTKLEIYGISDVNNTVARI